MKITPHFAVDEFACPLNGAPPSEMRGVLARLCEQLEVLRSELGAPVHIISGYRSPEFNEQIGGAPKSMHMQATASDIKVTGVSPRKVHSTILRLIEEGRMEEGGLGLYETFVHYDVRGKRARWYGRGVTP
jgi:uncharacterized protein YcbK (DUF882 family)